MISVSVLHDFCFAVNTHVLALYGAANSCCMSTEQRGCVVGPMELHPGPAIAALMKLSFDEQHRQAICALGQYHHGTVASLSIYENMNFIIIIINFL